jgi:lysozyme
MDWTPYISRVKQWEGFYRKPYWDYRQWSVGHGTRASGPNDYVDKEEADRRLMNEWGKSADIVSKWAYKNNAPMTEGTFAALTDLTYNSGGGWMNQGLGRAIKRGDMADARRRFTQYNKAGGKTLSGLVKRRLGGAQWLGAGDLIQKLPFTPSASDKAITAQPLPFTPPPPGSKHEDLVQLLAGEDAKLPSMDIPQGPPAISTVGPPSAISPIGPTETVKAVEDNTLRDIGPQASVSDGGSLSLPAPVQAPPLPQQRPQVSAGVGPGPTPPLPSRPQNAPTPSAPTWSQAMHQQMMGGPMMLPGQTYTAPKPNVTPKNNALIGLLGGFF